MKKRSVLLIILFSMLTIIGLYAYTNPIPNPGHGGDKVLVDVEGYIMTLQEAIDNDYFTDSDSSPSSDLTNSLTGAYHTGDDVYVSVAGSDKTLQDAIDEGVNGLCGTAGDTYSGSITFGEKGERIWVSVGGSEKTLQETINDGDLCCTPDCSCASTTCMGNTCPDGCGGNCAGTLSPNCGSRECGPAPNGCGSANECGNCDTSWIGSNYCSGGDVYRDRRTGACSGGSCVVNPVLVDDCSSSETCSGGSCVANLQWEKYGTYCAPFNVPCCPNGGSVSEGDPCNNLGDRCYNFIGCPSTMPIMVVICVDHYECK